MSLRQRQIESTQSIVKSIFDLPQELIDLLLSYASPRDLLKSRQFNAFFNRLAVATLFDRKDAQSLRYQKQLLQQWRDDRKTAIPTVSLLKAFQNPRLNYEDRMIGLQAIAAWERIELEVDEEFILKTIASLKAESENTSILMRRLIESYPFVKSVAVRKQIFDTIISVNLDDSFGLRTILPAYSKLFPLLTSPHERKRLVDVVIRINNNKKHCSYEHHIIIETTGKLYAYVRSSERERLWDVLMANMRGSPFNETLSLVLGSIYLRTTSEAERQQRLNTLIEITRHNITDKHLLRIIAKQYWRNSCDNKLFDGMTGMTNLSDDEHSDFRLGLLQIFRRDYPKDILIKIINEERQKARIVAAGALMNICRYVKAADDRKNVLDAFTAMVDDEALPVRQAGFAGIGVVFPLIESIDERKQAWNAFRSATRRLGNSKEERLIWTSVLRAIGNIFPHLTLPDDRHHALTLLLDNKGDGGRESSSEEFMIVLAYIFPYLIGPAEHNLAFGGLMEILEEMYDYKMIRAMGKIFASLYSSGKLAECKQIWDFTKTALASGHWHLDTIRDVLPSMFPYLIAVGEHEEILKSLLDSEMIAHYLGYVLGDLYETLTPDDRKRVLNVEIDLAKAGLNSVYPEIHLTHNFRKIFPLLTSPQERQQVFDVLMSVKWFGGNEYERSITLGDFLLSSDIKIPDGLLDLFCRHLYPSAAESMMLRLVMAGKCTVKDLEACNITQYSFGSWVLQQAKWIEQINNKIREREEARQFQSKMREVSSMSIFQKTRTTSDAVAPLTIARQPRQGRK